MTCSSASVMILLFSFCREYNLNQTISELEVKANSLDETRDSLEKKTKNLEEMVQTFTEENIKLKSKLESQQVLLDNENARCLEMKNLFDEERSQREEYQRNLTSSTEKIHSLELKVSEATGEKVKADEMNTNLKIETAKQKEMLEAKRNELKQATEQNKELRESLVRAQNQMKCLQENVVDIEHCLKERYGEYYQLQHNFQQVCKGKEILESELDEKSVKMEGLITSCNQFEKQIKSLEEKLNTCQSLYAESEEKYQVADTMVHKLELMNNEKQAMNDRACETISELQAENAAELRDKRELQDRVKDVQEEYEKYKLQAENEKTRMREDANRIKLVIQGDEAEREKVKKAQEEAIFKLNEKLKEMADIIDTDRDQIVKLQDRVTFLSNKNNDFLQETSRLKDQAKEKELSIGKFFFVVLR